MVLWVKFPTIFKRQVSYEISDVYVMALTFIALFYATKLTQKIIRKKMFENSSKNTPIIFNARGGRDQNDLFPNDNEIVEAILYCMRDDHSYRVLDRRIVSLVFNMSGQKLKGQMVTITPSLIRAIAKVSYRNPSVITQVGNFMISTSNASVLRARIIGAAITGIVIPLFNIGALYGVLIILITFQETSYVPCERYFEQLPKTEPGVIDVIVEDETESMVVVTENSNDSVRVFAPEKTKIRDEETDTYFTRYRKTRKKGKQVNFSDFRKTDPVLSQIPDEALAEFGVPERGYQSILQEFTPAEIIDVIAE